MNVSELKFFKMNKLTDKQYQQLVSQYNADPNNVTVCRALLAECNARGYTDVAAKLTAWIQTLPPPLPQHFPAASTPKCSSLSTTVWSILITFMVILGVMMHLSDAVRFGVLACCFCAALLFISLLPYFIAQQRHIQGKNGVLVLCVFLGWLFIPWLLALIWAVSAARNGDKNL